MIIIIGYSPARELQQAAEGRDAGPFDPWSRCGGKGDPKSDLWFCWRYEPQAKLEFRVASDPCLSSIYLMVFKKVGGPCGWYIRTISKLLNLVFERIVHVISQVTFTLLKGMKSTTRRWVRYTRKISLFPIGNRKYWANTWIACLVVGQRRETVGGRTNRSGDFTKTKLNIDQQFGEPPHKNAKRTQIVLGLLKLILWNPTWRSKVHHARSWCLKGISLSRPAACNPQSGLFGTFDVVPIAPKVECDDCPDKKPVIRYSSFHRNWGNWEMFDGMEHGTQVVPSWE